MRSSMWMVRPWGYLVFVIVSVVAAGPTAAAVTVKPSSKLVSATTTSATVTVYFAGEEGETATLTTSVSAPDGMITGLSGNGTTVKLKNGRGTGKVKITLSKNTGGTSRAAFVTINGATLSLTQAGAPCTISLKMAAGTTFEYFGGSKELAVTTPSGCTWNVTAPSWIQPAPPSGNGSGSVLVTLADNNGKSRKGTLTFTSQPQVEIKRSAGASENPTDKAALSIKNKASTKKVITKTFAITQKQRKFSPNVQITAPTPVTSAEDAARSYLIGRQAFSQVSGLMSGFGDAPLLYATVSTRRTVAIAAPAAKALLLPLRGTVRAEREQVERDCDSGRIFGTLTQSGTAKLQFESCRIGSQLLEGILFLKLRQLNNGEITGSLSIGSAADPFMMTTYGEADEVLSTVRTAVSGSISMTDYSSFSIDIDGFADMATYDGKKVLLDVKDFALSAADVANTISMTADGSLRTTIFEGGTFVSSQELHLQNFKVTATRNDFAETETLTFDGLFGIDSTPADSCLDGTFVITTTDPLVLPIGENPISGVIEVNGAVITATPDGGITVTINGNQVSLTAEEVAQLCPL